LFLDELEAHVEKAVLEGKLTGVKHIYEEDDDKPWAIPPSGKRQRVAKVWLARSNKDV
jgi:hypothetical protein